ncbi:MAG: Ig-like domain-containing protein [Geobacteraceae bacterium]|nr:Ig-like domain-containing protein [Geobacteraceae bacterium]
MKRITSQKAYLLCMVIMSLFVSILSGCGGGGGGTWTQPGTPGSSAARPTVTATVPATTTPGPTLNVPVNSAITVAFSKDMAPATITAAGAFTVTGPGATPVPGAVPAVTYDVASKTATFHPLAALTGGVTYTATVKGLGAAPATDLAGNALAGNAATPLVANDYVWTFTTSLAADTTLPQVTVTVPATTTPGPTLNVPTSSAISATFNEDMLPASVTGLIAFTVTGPGVTPVQGAAIPVTYVVATRTATFHPLAALAAGTTYTATIKGLGAAPAKDSAGNELAGVSTSPAAPNDYVWTFTTAGVVPPPALNISSFGIAATAGIQNTGSTTINGNAVLDPSPLCNSVQIDAAGGFGLCGGSPPIINGQVISLLYPDAGITSGIIKAQLLAEFLGITPPAGPPAAGSLGGGINLPAGTTLGAPTGSALVQGDNLFVPGVYQSLTSILITGDITLDAQGDPNGKFVFQSSSTVGTADGAASPGVHTQIILVNGAKASNVSWQAGTSATLGTNSDFHGNILASESITMKTGATSCGRLLAGAFAAGAFVFDSNVVSVPGNVNAPPSCQ